MEYNISPSVLLGLKSNLDNEKDDDHQCCHSQLTTLHLSCQNTQINWNIYISTIQRIQPHPQQLHE